jgi:hypothetical protein
LIIKKGTILEVKTMTFLLANMLLPIPRVWDVWIDRNEHGTGKCWFAIEYISGETWDVSWLGLSLKGRAEVTMQMKGYIDEL